ncbi:MAG: AGCS family alanine or glycine:cation symporter [Roseivirga sp.]|jgi:AGCS family alanine or glycine:cation symporter
MFGVKKGNLYNYIYIGTIVAGAVTSLGFVVNLIDGSFALMAIPTMVSAVLLAPKVIKASKVYFAKLKSGAFN